MNSKSGVLYIGATSDLDRRVFEHKSGLVEGFTKKYRVTRLTYVEEFDRAAEMVARERHLKRWTRRKKLELIQRQIPKSWIRAGPREVLRLRQPSLRMTQEIKASAKRQNLRSRCVKAR